MKRVIFSALICLSLVLCDNAEPSNQAFVKLTYGDESFCVKISDERYKELIFFQQMGTHRPSSPQMKIPEIVITFYIQFSERTDPFQIDSSDLPYELYNKLPKQGEVVPFPSIDEDLYPYIESLK